VTLVLATQFLLEFSLQLLVLTDLLVRQEVDLLFLLFGHSLSIRELLQHQSQLFFLRCSEILQLLGQSCLQLLPLATELERHKAFLLYKFILLINNLLDLPLTFKLHFLNLFSVALRFILELMVQFCSDHVIHMMQKAEIDLLHCQLRFFLDFLANVYLQFSHLLPQLLDDFG
jgi:hypothetical protein